MSLSHSFDILFAQEYKSVEIAILIHHFQRWILVNKRKGVNFREGRTWTYQSIEDITAHFPYWSFDQVNRLLRKMVDLKIIQKANFNPSKFLRTIWYSFVDEEKFNVLRFRQMEKAEEPSPNGDFANSIIGSHSKTYTYTDDTVQCSETMSVKSEKKNKEEFLRSTGIDMRKDVIGVLSQKHSMQELKEAFQKFKNYPTKITNPVAMYRKILSGNLPSIPGSKGSENKRWIKEFVKDNGITYIKIKDSFIIDIRNENDIMFEINPEDFKFAVQSWISMQ